MEIEPDGQQFLNASAADPDTPKGDNGDDTPAPPPPPPPTGATTTRTTVVVVALVIVVLAIGGVAFITLTGDNEGRRELETDGASGVDIRDRVNQTTTTEKPPETTAPPTTAVPTDDGATPFPDFGPPPPPGVQPGAPTPAPGAQTTCPGGGINTQVVSTSVTQVSASSVDLEVKGTAVNNTTAPVMLEIALTISHNGNNHPNPWVSLVQQSRPTVAPGETSTWTFTGQITGGNSANVTAIGGGFRWADPSMAACPTQ